jgi:hypothetical protein
MRAALAQARLGAERDAIAAAIPPDRSNEVRRTIGQLVELRQDRTDLHTGHGRYAATPLGDAARTLSQATSMRRQAEGFAAMSDMGRRMRRQWRADARSWAERESLARAQFEQLATPETARLDEAIGRLDAHFQHLSAAESERSSWIAGHPEATRRLQRIDLELTRVEHQLRPQPATMAAERAVGADRGVRPLTPRPGPSLQPHRHIPPPTPDIGRDLGPSIGL